jgi:hypothetical protein
VQLWEQRPCASHSKVGSLPSKQVNSGQYRAGVPFCHRSLVSKGDASNVVMWMQFLPEVPFHSACSSI